MWGGGGEGGWQSPASRTPFSRTSLSLCLPIPALYCVSPARYHVNHAVWLPILIGSALALSKIKNCVVNRTTPHSPTRSLKRHSFDTSLHHAGKSSDLLRIFPDHTEKYRDRSKQSLTTFDLARFVVLTENFDQQDRRETDTTDTVDTRLRHAISFMSYDVSDLKRFPYFFCYPEYEFSFFDFSHV